MKALLTLAAVTGLSLAALPRQAPDFATLKQEAEKHYAAGSYELARRAYSTAAGLQLGEDDARWVAFRLADTGWRSAAATEDADTSELDAARVELEAIAPTSLDIWKRDLVWAEARESLGDFQWSRRSSRNWGAAWPHYQAALDWWAGTSEIELARRRYLDIVWKVATPPWHRTSRTYGYYGRNLGREILRNAVEIARAPEDVSRAYYLLGMHEYHQGQNVQTAERALDALAKSMEAGKDAGWYDDALFHIGRFLEDYGQATQTEDGWQWEKDYVGAVSTYRRLLREFSQGESRYHDDARRRIEQITKAGVGVGVDRFFLPESEIQYRLHWRNVERVQLALYAVDLTGPLAFGSDDPDDFLQAVQLEPIEPHSRWVHETGDEGKHLPGQAALTLKEKLPRGAWVLEARGQGERSRALILVSDAALTVKATGTKLLAWLTDLKSGEPLSDAKVRVWERYYDGNDWRWKDYEGETAADGTRLFDLRKKAERSRCFVAASLGDRQAFALTGSWYHYEANDEWRIYATTDRPTYRPLDTVEWKIVSRVRRDSAYKTPADATLGWEIRDPRGSAVAEGDMKLNAFGAAWAKLETTKAMPLGEYHVAFTLREKGSEHSVGGATLFRLEEYKAPEFEVKVEIPEDEDGKPELFRVGDRVRFEVEATYMFGGPVAEANVEVVVHQKPFHYAWKTEREFPWFYPDQGGRQWGGWQGEQVSHQRLQTDRAGRAFVEFETPFDLNSDYEYTIEARVTDASRREIMGRGSLRVTRQSTFVRLEVEHAIHRPGAAVEIDVTAEDPNGNPVEAEGELEVTRERWVEIWFDPDGREVRGAELERLRALHGTFPPAPEKSARPWRRKLADYAREVVATGKLRTGEDGTAQWSFVPETDGHFKIRWRGMDDRGVPVEATATAFVADESTRELGYQPGGIEILVDRDTFEVGEEAAIILAAPASGRWVLFCVEGEDLLHHEVVHLGGRVKLLRLDVGAQHVPNVYLSASMVSGGEAFSDMEEIVVPPTGQFLDVELSYDKGDYLPGEEGALNVLVRDKSGEPVAVELGVAVYDDSLSYIQTDYAGDPRQFFYGQRNALRVVTRGTFNQGSFVRYKKTEKGALYDERLGLPELKDELHDDADYESRGLRESEGADGFYAGRKVAAPATERLQALGYAGEASKEAPARSRAMADGPASPGPGGLAAGGGGGEPTVRVRSDFRDTAVWVPDVVTGADGKAQVTVPFPDSTTRWKAVVRAADRGSRFGIGEGMTRTRQPLIARLQGPRFFQTGDEVVLSANLNNNTDAPMGVRVRLEAEGLELVGLVDGDGVSRDEDHRIVLEPNGQWRLDWLARVREPGVAKLKLMAVGEEHGDAVERSFPIYEHGIEAFVARTGKFDGREIAFDLPLPEERKAGSTELSVQITPSLAVTMLDALPYLVDYPYGCTEQTLSRFLPSVIVARTLSDFGLSPGDAMSRVFGGIEREHAAKTHPDGQKALDRLGEMTKAGLERLYDFQHSDGGWGWWKGDDSDRYMTAYVVWGLAMARDAGVDVRDGTLEKASRWLAVQLVEEEENVHMQAWMLHAITAWRTDAGDLESLGFVTKAVTNVLRSKKDRLNAYSRALMAISMKRLGREEEARSLVDNLFNGVKIDETPDTSVVMVGEQSSEPYVLKTAHWGADRIWRRWHEGGIETTAFVLRAILAVDPTHELVEPVTNWLIKNRRAAQWSNTRDTAIVVLALNEYLRKSGELASGVAYELEVNGRSTGTVELSKDELLRAPSVFPVDPEALRSGDNRIVIRKTKGEGPLYFAAHATFFSLEEPIPARGSEIFVRREYYKLVGRETLLKGFVHDRVPLLDGETVQSGERIEVVLTAEAKNDLEYLVFEDLKPAGFEAVRVRSGEPLSARELKRSEVAQRFAQGAETVEQNRRRAGDVRQSPEPTSGGEGYTGRSRSAHQELRDRKVALFLGKLPQGVWEMRYDLRAEVPGKFHALPLMAHAMYVPEIRGNSNEVRVEVVDR